ncbi:PPE domain-containing protein [Rhodococcus koreensis]
MTDPAYIKDPENFHSDQWDHARIASAVAGMDVEHVSGVARAWTELGTTAHDAIVEFSDAIKKTISESWQGSAASAAYVETERYSTSAPEAQDQLHGVAAALTPLAETVASLRSQVPETIGTGLWDKLTPWDTDTEDEYYRREGEAREKMATIYNPGLATSDGNVPSFTRPESRVDVPSGPSAPGVDYSSGAPSSSEQFGRPSTGRPSAGDAPDIDSPDSDASAAPGTPAADGAQQNAETVPSSATAPAATAPASVPGDQAQSRSAMPPGVDSSSGAGARSAGAGAGAGGFGVGGLGGASGASGVGAGGRTGAGARPGSTPPGVAGAAAGGRTGAGMRGTGAMGGGMMGGAPGAAKGGGEDKEHKTPDYLITLDNGNELIGKLPLVSPPVIGA